MKKFSILIALTVSMVAMAKEEKVDDGGQMAIGTTVAGGGIIISQYAKENLKNIKDRRYGAIGFHKEILNEKGKVISIIDREKMTAYYKNIHNHQENESTTKMFLNTLKKGDKVTTHLMEFEKFRRSEIEKFQLHLAKALKGMHATNPGMRKIYMTEVFDATEKIKSLKSIELLDVTTLNSILADKGLSESEMKGKLELFLNQEFKQGKNLVGLTVESASANKKIAKAARMHGLGIASTVAGLATFLSAINYSKIGDKSMARLDNGDRTVVDKSTSDDQGRLSWPQGVATKEQ
jgi:hypothetical protein